MDQLVHKNNNIQNSNQKAFTLLEIVIVLSIMGAIIGIALPRLMDKKSNSRKVMREFIIAGKDLRSRAKISGSTYRLAFDLENGGQTWWVEKSSQSTLIDKKKIEIEREKLKKPDNSNEDEKSRPQFEPDTSIFKKKQKLPQGYKFKQIESSTQDLIYTEGMGYIHFFSQGLIESSSIQIEDPKKNIWTLVYNPLNGHTDIIPEAKSLKDLAR